LQKVEKPPDKKQFLCTCRWGRNKTKSIKTLGNKLPQETSGAS